MTPAAEELDMVELAHFCSRYVDQSAVDKVLAKYERFCLVGQEASVPYVAKRLSELGKSFTRVPSYAPEMLATVEGQYDCLIICGAQGRYPITAPAVALMTAQAGWTTLHVAPELANLVFVVPRERGPVSGNDWFYPLKLVRGQNDEEINEVRTMGRQLRDKLKERQLNRPPRAMGSSSS